MLLFVIRMLSGVCFHSRFTVFVFGFTYFSSYVTSNEARLKLSNTAAWNLRNLYSAKSLKPHKKDKNC